MINWKKYDKLGELAGKVGNRLVVEALKRKLVDERMPIKHRGYIIQSIGKFGTSDDLPLLRDIFLDEMRKTDDCAGSNRCAIADILGRLGNRDDIQILEKVGSYWEEEHETENLNISIAVNKLKDKYEW